MKQQTITVGGRTYIYIPGDPISPEELDRQLTAQKISHYRFAMETLRTNDNMSEDEKKVRMSSFAWELDQLLKKERQRTI